MPHILKIQPHKSHTLSARFSAEAEISFNVDLSMSVCVYVCVFKGEAENWG